MKLSSSLLLLCFLSLSLFGFLGMLDTQAMSHAPETCLASLAQNGACPLSEETFAVAIFHTNAFKVFSTTLLSVFLAGVLLAIAFFVRERIRERFLVRSWGFLTFTERARNIAVHFLSLRKLRLSLVRFELSPTSL